MVAARPPADRTHLQFPFTAFERAALSCPEGLILCIRAADIQIERITPFAMLGLAAIMLHSAVDYPFRVTALNCLIGFLCALVVGGARPAAVVATRDEPKLGFVGGHPIG